MIMKAINRAVMVCSESLLFKKNNLFELFFKLFGGPLNKSIHVINYTLQGVIIIKSLIYGSKRESCSEILWIVSFNIKYRTSFIFLIFLYQNYLCFKDVLLFIKALT